MAIKIYGRLSSANVQKLIGFVNMQILDVINLNYGGDTWQNTNDRV